MFFDSVHRVIKHTHVIFLIRTKKPRQFVYPRFTIAMSAFIAIVASIITVVQQCHMITSIIVHGSTDSSTVAHCILLGMLNAFIILIFGCAIVLMRYIDTVMRAAIPVLAFFTVALTVFALALLVSQYATIEDVCTILVGHYRSIEWYVRLIWS